MATLGSSGKHQPNVNDTTRPKRKAYMLPAFTDFRKNMLQELGRELGVRVAGLRKEQLIDCLYEVDNSATFGFQSQYSSMSPEQLLVLCVKARIRYFRQQPEEPCFAGLASDLTYLGSGTDGAAQSQPQRHVMINVVQM